MLRRRIEPADIDAVGVLCDRLGTRHSRRRDPHLARCRAADHAKIRRGARALQLFISHKVEELVTDDWPTEGESLGRFLELGRLRIHIGQVVVTLARHVVIAVNEVGAALDFVGPALRDRIDVGTGVALLGHIEVGDVDLDRLDRVDRNRLLERREIVRLETKGVGNRHTVNGRDVVLGVLTAGRDFPIALVGL